MNPKLVLLLATVAAAPAERTGPTLRETARISGRTVAVEVDLRALRDEGMRRRIRDEVEHLLSLGQSIFFDVSLAQPAMEDYVAEVRKNLEAALAPVSFFSYGHLGDGNLHFTVCKGMETEQHRETIERVIYEPLAKLAGSVSAEHGIGLEKQPWLNVCRSETEIALMRRLKHALDPKGILNRGKIFGYEGGQVPA